MILDVIDELGSQRNNNNILAINHFKKGVPSLQPLLAYDPSFKGSTITRHRSTFTKEVHIEVQMQN